MKFDLEGNLRIWGSWSVPPDSKSVGWSFFGGLDPLNTVEIECNKKEMECVERRAEVAPTRTEGIREPYSLLLRPPRRLYIVIWDSTKIIAEWTAGGLENATLRISLGDRSVELVARENTDVLGQKNSNPRTPQVYVLK
jgi:hypothetical protein